MKLKMLLCIGAILAIVGWGPMSLNVVSSYFQNTSSPIKSESWMNQTIKTICSEANNLDPAVLKVGLTAYIHARQKGLDNKGLLTLVDYSKPSDERRLWVIDVKNLKVLFNTWVAHGKNSGSVNATSFSNQLGSLKSSLGVFLTEEPYVGNDGYSLRIEGLESHINNNALKRNIVVHGAWYVGGDIAKSRGMLGRSFGCLAVSKNVATPLINTIKDNTLVVAYYPDKNWLDHSTFLST